MKRATTKMAIVLATVLLFSALGYSRGMPNTIVGCTKSPHIDIAIFQKVNGHDAYRFVVQLKYSDAFKESQDINQATHNKAGSQSSLLNDKQKLNTNMNSKGSKAYCQLSMLNDGENTNVSGRCDVLISDMKGQKVEYKAWIKTTPLHASGEWQLVYHEDGIDIYASKNYSINQGSAD